MDEFAGGELKVFGLEDIFASSADFKGRNWMPTDAHIDASVFGDLGNGQAADEIKGGVDFDLVGQRPCGMELEFVARGIAGGFCSGFKIETGSGLAEMDFKE